MQRKIDKFKARRFMDCEIPGFGKVKILKMTTGEFVKATAGEDKVKRLQQLTLECAYDGDQPSGENQKDEPIYQSIDEINGSDHAIFDAISDLVVLHNRAKKEDAEKKSETPLS